MALWEFSIRYDDGTSPENTVLADGLDEDAAAASASLAVAEHPGLLLLRPGSVVPPDVEARWREVYEGRGFPEIVPRAGRFALYARTGSTIAKEP